jgi:hypothetical protein
MRRSLLFLALVLWCTDHALNSQQPQAKAPGHYMFAWTGDVAEAGNDFLAVIDADPHADEQPFCEPSAATPSQSPFNEGPN